MSKIWLSETENIIGRIEDERKIIADDLEFLSAKLTAKDEELADWKIVLQSYKKRQELESPQPSLFLTGPNSFKEYSHKDIVLLVRDQNEGNIPMTQVTEILKGKVTNPAHAASSAYSTVKRLVKQGKVTKLRPGLYRWINGAKEQHPAPTDLKFAIGDRVHVPDSDVDAFRPFLGKVGVVLNLQGIDTEGARKRGRTGKSLSTPWYGVTFDGDERNYFVNEAWLEAE